MVPGNDPATPDVGGRADSSAVMPRVTTAGAPSWRSTTIIPASMPGISIAGVQYAIHELLEVDRAPELAEEPVSAALLLGALERAGELAGELVHLAPHLVDCAHELLVRRGRRRSPAAHDETSDDSRGHEGRGDDHDRRRHVVSQLIRDYFSLY